MSERETKPTTTLDPRTITGPNWPVALATLEQIKPWAPLAVKHGLLARVNWLVRQMAEPNASAGLVNELQDVVDALRHMPWEGK